MTKQQQQENHFPITNVQYVLKRHEELCKSARDLVEKKGKDYNRQEQSELTGDTLANMRLAKDIGLADSYCQSTMIRLFDKMMRLKSLTKNPAELNIAVKDENVHDTIRDAINYLVYLDIFYDEEK